MNRLYLLFLKRIGKSDDMFVSYGAWLLLFQAIVGPIYLSCKTICVFRSKTNRLCQPFISKTQFSPQQPLYQPPYNWVLGGGIGICGRIHEPAHLANTNNICASRQLNVVRSVAQQSFLRSVFHLSLPFLFSHFVNWTGLDGTKLWRGWMIGTHEGVRC